MKAAAVDRHARRVPHVNTPRASCAAEPSQLHYSPTILLLDGCPIQHFETAGGLGGLGPRALRVPALQDKGPPWQMYWTID